MAPMATTLPARNRYGTRSAILGPGVPWRTSLIHRMGWRMGWPTAKKIQKLRAALASVGYVGLHLADGLEEVGPGSAVDGDAANAESK